MHNAYESKNKRLYLKRLNFFKYVLDLLRIITSAGYPIRYYK